MQRVRLTADDLPSFCLTTKTLWEDMESCKVILLDAEIMPSSDQGHGSSSHQTSSSFWQRIQCKLYIMCFVSLSCHLNKFLLQQNPGRPSAGGPRMDRRAVTNLTPCFGPAALSSEDKRQRGEKPSLRRGAEWAFRYDFLLKKWRDRPKKGKFMPLLCKNMVWLVKKSNSLSFHMCDSVRGWGKKTNTRGT